MWSGQDINYNTEKRVHVEQSYIQMLYVLQFLPVFTDFPLFLQMVGFQFPLLTFGVVTLGLLPPMAPGRMDPVSL